MTHRTSPAIFYAPISPGQIAVIETSLNGLMRGRAMYAHHHIGPMDQVKIGFNIDQSCFGIPVFDKKGKPLPLAKIARNVRIFTGWVEVWAKARPDDVFLVPKIGCGEAGYAPKDIAPLFTDAAKFDSVHLPPRFWAVLNKIDK